MPWVEFLREAYLKDCYLHTPQETRFLKGQIVELSQMSAQRWLRRNACRVVDPPDVHPQEAEDSPCMPCSASPSILAVEEDGALDASLDQDEGGEPITETRKKRGKR